jgi:membrane-associated phospholipid phosphatase
MNRIKTLLIAAKDHLWHHRVALLILFCCVLVPMALLEDLVEGVRHQYAFPFDVQILHSIHTHESPLKSEIVVWATRAGYWLIVPFVLLVIAGLRHFQRPAQISYFTVTVIGAFLLNFAAKQFFGRTRPDLWVSLLPEKSFSFPSGHSMLSAALAYALVVLLWQTRLRLLALLSAPPAVFLVGLSRLYLGVHYPSDVLAGWCAGLIWATGAFFICRPLRPAS